MTEVHSHFGVTAQDRIGGGAEADIYALPGKRVLRVMKPGAEPGSEQKRRELLARLAKHQGDLSFAMPEVLDHGDIAGRLFSVERRIAGQSMDVVLKGTVKNRDGLIRNYLQAALDLGQLPIDDCFGELAGPAPITAPDQDGALSAIAHRSLRAAGLHADAGELARALPHSARPGLVHVDYFPGNVMCEGTQITGVIDFGYATIAADPRLTAIIGAACLHSRISANASRADRQVADDWLRAHGLEGFVVPTNRWLAAFWAFAYADDLSLEIWGRAQLGL